MIRGVSKYGQIDGRSIGLKGLEACFESVAVGVFLSASPASDAKLWMWRKASVVTVFCCILHIALIEM